VHSVVVPTVAHNGYHKDVLVVPSYVEMQGALTPPTLTTLHGMALAPATINAFPPSPFFVTNSRATRCVCSRFCCLVCAVVLLLALAHAPMHRALSQYFVFEKVAKEVFAQVRSSSGLAAVTPVTGGGAVSPFHVKGGSALVSCG
jgi:hypothetical protein